jgi:hypothetical protein
METAICDLDLRKLTPTEIRKLPPTSRIRVRIAGFATSETPANAAVMKTPFARAMPTQAPIALLHPLVSDVRAIRRKSTPGMSNARKCATATAMKTSISPHGS